MTLSRRTFLGSAAAAAGGALVIGFTFRNRFRFGRPAPTQQKPLENPFDAWVHIKPDNSSDLVFAQAEMGQGVYTALPMLLADEADLDWDRVKIVQSDFSRGTGGSGSVTSNYDNLRRAGAVVRTMMMAAAAQRWGVGLAECTASKSAVTHEASGRRATYGELVYVDRSRYSASRCTRQMHRCCTIRPGCAAAGDGLRGDRTMPNVWGKSSEVRCDEGTRYAGRAAGIRSSSARISCLQRRWRCGGGNFDVGGDARQESAGHHLESGIA
jgi:hypothetical protein